MEDDQWEAACQLSQDSADDFNWRTERWTETGPQTDHSPGQCSRALTCGRTTLAGYLLGLSEMLFCVKSTNILTLGP